MKAILGCALACTVIGAGTAPASATPSIDVRAEWGVTFLGPPPGVEITCTGNAGRTLSGCSDRIALRTSVTSTQSLSVGSTGGFTIANTSDGSLTGFLDFNIGWSAFNPGVPQIGLTIDNPAAQAATFSSIVDGGGSATTPFGIFDIHSCSVGFLGQSGYVFSPTTCGVPSPDSSSTEYLIALADLAPGASLDFTAILGITADFTFLVPEPSSIAMLLLSMSALGAIPLARVL